MALPIFPDQSVLPGLAYSVLWSPSFINMPTQTTASGADIDLGLAATPVHDFTLKYNLLRDSLTTSELKVLMGFFLAMQGSVGRFAFKNVDDSSATWQPIGTTDGSTTTFQLARTYGAYGAAGTEPVGILDTTQPVTIGLGSPRANTLIVDGAGAVQQFNQQGVQSSYYSGSGGGCGIAFDSSGNLYVTGSGTTITKVTTAGVVSTFATITSEDLFGLAFDSSGNLYAAGDALGKVYKITSGGTVSTFASGFTNPHALAFDSGGNLYVSDPTTGKISKITSGGSVSTFLSGYTAVDGLGFDSSGNLYFCLESSAQIYKSTSGGVVKPFAVLPPAVPGPVFATGLAVDPNGNVFVSNYSGGTITKISPAGNASLFTGGLAQPFFLYAGVLPTSQSSSLYTLNTAAPGNQQVVFGSAPTTGQQVFASMSYLYYCKLADNANTFEKFMNQLWLTQKIRIHSCRAGA